MRLAWLMSFNIEGILLFRSPSILVAKMYDEQMSAVSTKYDPSPRLKMGFDKGESKYVCSSAPSCAFP